MPVEPFGSMRLSAKIPADLPQEVRETLRGYAKDIVRLYASTLESLILYGSAARGEFLSERSNLNLLIVLANHDVNLLERYAKIHRRWSAEKIVIPLFLTEKEIRMSQRLFPLEYLEIQEHHVLLAGHELFTGLCIERENLAVQCAREIAGNLMRLRQRCVEGGGKPEAFAVLLPLSLTSLLPCLRGVYRVGKLSVPPSTEALLHDLSPQFGIDGTVFGEVWDLKRGVMTPGPAELPRLFERYVTSLQNLSEWVDHKSLQPRS
ncbi:MAG: nucleotidyltransferase domain-containing protein [Nitrospiraceae bacterium]|nr:nucleotidyltransferase domain-containing protein [Nitrospiraceae bacterium]